MLQATAQILDLRVWDPGLLVGDCGGPGVQASAQVRRRLAELELDMDRQQGWVRGGTKSEVGLLPVLSMHQSSGPFRS